MSDNKRIWISILFMWVLLGVGWLCGMDYITYMAIVVWWLLVWNIIVPVLQALWSYRGD